MAAPSGGGGGGGPVGFSNSFTGAAQSIDIVGNHAYGYSGGLGSNTSDVVHLKFTTGSYYFVGRITVNGAMVVTSPAVGRTTIFQINMNGGLIAQIKVDSAEEDQPSTAYNDVIIPPYTEVEVTGQSDGADADRLTTALITGRIYR